MYNPYDYQYPYSAASIYVQSNTDKEQLFKKLEDTPFRQYLQGKRQPSNLDMQFQQRHYPILMQKV